MCIKNIIFDIGGVLADSKNGHWFITPNFFNIVDESLINQEQLNIALKNNLSFQTQNPKTEKEEHEMFANYYYHVLKEINYPDDISKISKKIADDCCYNDEKFIFYDDVHDFLKEMSVTYNLYIISNGWPSSFRILKNMQLDKYFKDIFISSMYTTTKEESLFDIFLEKHRNIVPNESLYIDDRRHILDKASTYDFNLLLMDRKKKYSNERFQVINNMDDILSFLKKIK
ncbi:MAG: HAD family hydrolase [Bacilli bacterium]|nr:HAD family hydrolase [Bacilli bacterium]